MMNEEVPRYRKLSGDNNSNTPVSRIGGFLDGYEKGRQDVLSEVLEMAYQLPHNHFANTSVQILLAGIRNLKEQK